MERERERERGKGPTEVMIVLGREWKGELI
jgi:hypothetical protein